MTTTFAVRVEPTLEICICAAVKFADGRIVRGHRHDACFRTAEGWTPKPDGHNHVQGFITSRNRFVDRTVGAELQNAAGIISAHTGKPVEGELFSEDLYFDLHDHVAWNRPYEEPSAVLASGPPPSAGVTPRVLELAKEAARRRHIDCGMHYEQHRVTSLDIQGHRFDSSVEQWGFSACPHPDCRLVRESVASVPAASLPVCVLCYVGGSQAFFTTQPLDKQWGDDWDDAPYEHNAGQPYGPHDGEDWTITQVFYSGPFRTPDDGYTNSPYSVLGINRGDVAWLRHESGGRPVPAGVTLPQFIELVRAGGGEVYLPYGSVPAASEEQKK